MPPKPPNVLFIITHDTGQHLGCYGAPFPTPNLDALARAGVLFENNFCTAPQCTPSRGSILTGKMPHANGLMGLTNYGWNLPETNETIPKILGAHGYSTHLVGLQHTHRDATTLGYDEVSDRKKFPFYAGATTQDALKFLDRVAAGEVPQPFYCSVGFFETHRPFPLPEEDELDPEVPVPPYLPDAPAIRREIGGFQMMLEEVDDQVGRLVAKLAETGLADDTLVIFSVDHGWAFPRAKCTLYDPGIRTALIMHQPGRVTGGRRVTDLVSNVDLFPTICELAGVDLPADLQARIQGHSFAPLLREAPAGYAPRTYISAELTHHDSGFNPMRCWRTPKWKYIWNMADFPAQFEIPDDIMDAPGGKAYRAAHPEYETPRPPDELYDLEADPDEQNNLADDPAFQEVKTDLRAKLEQFMEDTDDPALEGEVPAPKKPGFFVY